MEINGMNLCDFCFTPIVPGSRCHVCGLTHETYNASADLLKPGTNLLGKYIIGRALGRGGFGATYLAFSTERMMPVAVKEFFPAGIACRDKDEVRVAVVSGDELENFKKGTARFFEEAKTISNFNMTPNVVSVYEFFYANDTVYYSMEYLDGIDLKGYVKRRGGKLLPSEALTVLKSICDALVTVHRTGTLHRDISPDNVFICIDGTVKLIDFGAAKQFVTEHSRNLSVILKQGFAPLEQYKKDGNQGMWTDIYAVGATVYYALTGKIPEDPMSRLEKPELDFDKSLGITKGLADIISKCLNVRIEERYHSAMEVLEALSSLDEPYTSLGAGYVQDVFNGTAVSAALSGGGVQFSTYGTGFRNYMPPEPDNSGLIKGIIAAACIIAILVIGIVVACLV